MRIWFPCLVLAACTREPAGLPSVPPGGPPPVPIAHAPGGGGGPPAASGRGRCWHHVVSYYSQSENEPSPGSTAFASGPSIDSESGFIGSGAHTLAGKAKELADKQPRLKGDVCDDRRRDGLEVALAALVPPRTGKVAASTPWDHTTPLAYHDLVAATLALTPEEERQLDRDGFVVPARLAYDDYTRAYDDVHRGQLPVFVSVDSILHAVYATHDQLLADVEQAQLITRLDTALGAMHCGLALAAKDYPPEIARDVDLYLTIARSLLAGQPVLGELGEATDAAAQPILDLIAQHDAIHTIQLFGRPRAFDASQFTPRGHYADDPTLTAYFQASMWLSRVELNLVSRDSRSSQPGYTPDPSETPREAVVALALADLAKRTGALGDLAVLDQAWAAVAGQREDIPLARLGELRAKARIATLKDPKAADKLRAAIGDAYQRTVNVSPMPNVKHLPAIASILGARITPDTVALGGLIAGRGPELQATEVAFMLGQDRALQYVDPKLGPRLRAARDQLAHAGRGDDLYSAWLAAIEKLAAPTEGAAPSFMHGEAYQDLRLDSTIAAYGQLRHNHVLVAAQVYDQGGCEIPDGYVEPAIETYRALAEYAARGKRMFAAIDRKHATEAVAYFTRLERLMKVLVALSREELANRPLSAAARQFLSMIVEDRVAMSAGYSGTFPVATYDGWYLDLFLSVESAFHGAGFVADYATYDRDDQQGIHYLGARGPRLGVFAIDTGGAPRLMVGPVAQAFEAHTALQARLDDSAAATAIGDAPWATGYTVPAPAAPPFTILFHRTPGPHADVSRATFGRTLADDTIHLEAPHDLGTVTIDLLDHHYTTLTTVTLHARAGVTELKVPATSAPIESLRIRIGAYTTREDLDLRGDLAGELGGAKLKP